MSNKQRAYDLLAAISNVDELDELLTGRERLRRIWSALQDAYSATHNELFLDYLDVIQKSGSVLNADIQMWFDRQASQFSGTPREEK